MDLSKQMIYRVYFDESYDAEKDSGERKNKAQYAELRGKYGTVYSYSPCQLAATFNTKRPLRGAPKAWTVIQNGDTEAVILFPDNDLDRVASLIKAKRKRVLSAEVLAALRERAKNLSKKPGFGV